MNSAKRILSLILAIILVISNCPVITQVSAAESGSAAFSVESDWAMPGSTVDVDVYVSGNPGILGATLSVSYDDSLTLINAAPGAAFSPLDISIPGKYVSGCKFNWDALEIADEDIHDGVILTLTFQVAQDAVVNSALDINISVEEGDVFDADFNDVAVSTEGSGILIIDYWPGDVNGDSTPDNCVINSKDVVLLRREITGGYEQTINSAAADVNDDGKLNSKDVVMIRRYITGGYDDLVLKPSTPKCIHDMEQIPYQAASCTEDGNISYYYCPNCDKIYNDEKGSVELSADSVILAATGHTAVNDPYVAPDYGVPGLTEGSHCLVCGQVLVPQDPIPPLERDEYVITYDVADGDTYLEGLISSGELVNPNPTTYTEKDSFDLEKLNVPGYTFDGWYDSSDNRVGRIENRTGNIRLYAHWTKKVYNITYESDMVPITEDKFPGYHQFTTDIGKEALPKPRMDKYTFVGWSDKDGNMWTSIPSGQVNDITLYANWASNRNMASAVKELKDPVIVEDPANGLILFGYEIGTIKNVPLATTLNLQCANGLITTVEFKEETYISEEQAESIANAISKVTSNSTAWTLEKNWNETTEVSQETLDETKLEIGEATTKAQSLSNNFNIGTSFGKTNTKADTESGSFKISSNKSHSTTDTTETGQEFGLSVDGKYSRENTVGGSLGGNIGSGDKAEKAWGVTAGLNAGKKTGWEIGAGADYKNYGKNTTSGTDSWSVDAEIAGEKSHSTTNEKSWNTDIGFSASAEVSKTETMSKTMSSLIANTYGYGESYSEGGSNSEAQEFQTSDSESNEFSSSVTYFSSTMKTVTKSFSSTGNTTGNYRMVNAGTVHVFAMVGYDIANSTYFVYTYNVLDDKYEEYLDYSYDGSFTDYETSIIPFEIPVFVNDYVNNRIAETYGLQFDNATATFTKYDPEEEEASTIISVPSYHVKDNGDETFSSVKVEHISSDLFRGNDEIKAVILGHHIKEIPDNAFEGCTSLEYVICPGVTSIGSEAFKGCTNLKKFTIASDITYIGEEAFMDVPEIKVEAANLDVARNIASSGAKMITLDISMIPDADPSDDVIQTVDELGELVIDVGEISYFQLWGKDKTYSGLKVVSDAETTILNGVNIVETSGIPLTLSSGNVTLNRVCVNANAYAMLLTADHTDITLNEQNVLVSASGNTIVSRDITLKPLKSTDVGELVLGNKDENGNSDGDLLICGAVEGESHLTCHDIIYLNEDEYELYKQGVLYITLDANGGALDETELIAYRGSSIGDLPVPVKDYHDFDGWYTGIDGGEEVTADMVLDADTTLYAHWTEKALSGWVLPDEVPEDAQVVQTKWSYTLTTNAESKNTTMDGFEQIGSYWVEDGTGSAHYASFPSGYDTGNQYYTGFMKSPYANVESETNKREVTNTWAGYVYWHWMYDCGGGNASSDYWRNIYYKSGTRGSYYYKYFGAFTSTKNYSKSPGGTYSTPDANAGRQWYEVPTSDRYKYADTQGSMHWYRFDYYTSTYTDYYKMFQYQKVEELESETEITESDSISNVVQWVLYREK